MLDRLREIGRVSLLTTSQREYAEKIDEAFGLGFEQMYCREDLFVFHPFAEPKTEAIAPQIRANRRSVTKRNLGQVEDAVLGD